MVRKRSKKIFSCLLVIAMLITVFPLQAFAEGEVTANVSIAVSNEFQLAKDDATVLISAPVTLPAGASVQDALKEAHVLYHANGEGAYGVDNNGWITKFWGEDTGNVMSFQNGSMNASVVADGDDIEAFVYNDYSTDIYSRFDKLKIDVKPNTDFTLTLFGIALTNAWGGAPAPISGATVLVGKEVKPSVPAGGWMTDADGKVTMSLDTEGTYYISAKNAEGTLMPAHCTVIVSNSFSEDPQEVVDSDKEALTVNYAGGDSIPLPVTGNSGKSKIVWVSDNPDVISTARAVVRKPAEQTVKLTATITYGEATATKEFEITVPALEVEVVVSAEDAMHNIAAKYAQDGFANDANAPWIAADMAAYAKAFPDTQNKLNAEQRQEYLDILIEKADAATTPGDLSKYIIALRSMGYDARQVVTSDLREIDVVKKLTDIVDAGGEPITGDWAYFDVPYIIIALQQDANYATEAQIGFLINTAVASKADWQSTVFGTDAATPMMLALAPYYAANAEVKAAVDTASDNVKAAQQDGGAVDNPFVNPPGPSAASTGLAITAFVAVGENPDLIKAESGKSLVDGLLSEATDTADGFKTSGFDTEQGFRGLVALALYKKSGSAARVYDFSDMPKEKAEASWITNNCPVSISAIPEDSVIEVKVAGSEDAVEPVVNGKYDLAAGIYTYTVSKAGYVAKTGNFTVSADDVANHVPKNISVSLSSDLPPGINTISVSVAVKMHPAGGEDGQYTYRYNAADYENIVSKSVELASGSSVFDALDAVLTAEEISYTEKTFGYISEIDGISEFDYGRKSGWLFMVNGTEGTRGCREHKLTSNSNVIWFYTDDFTKEKGSEAWTPHEPPAQSTASTIAPEVTVSGDTATANVTNNQVADAIAAADKDGNKEITIAPDKTGDAKSVSVNVPTSAAKDIAGKKDLDLNIETKAGNISIPGDVLASIAESAAGSDISINVEQKTAEDVADESIDASSGIVISVTISSGGENITNFGGKSIKIDLPVNDKYMEGGSYNVVQISADGSKQVLKGKCVKVDGKLVVRVSTTHLSTFVVLEGKVSAFADIETHWAKEGIEYVYGIGIMNGTSETTFSPETTLSRAMLVTMLHRLEGRPKIDKTNSFTDVEAGRWYADAISWAAENGIVGGYGDGIFAPNEDITREQMAAILHRYSKYKKYDVSKVGDLSGFADLADISTWALDSLKWANGAGLISGRTKSTIVPGGTATRAEAAIILMRFIENVVK